MLPVPARAQKAVLRTGCGLDVWAGGDCYGSAFPQVAAAEIMGVTVKSPEPVGLVVTVTETRRSCVVVVAGVAVFAAFTAP